MLTIFSRLPRLVRQEAMHRLVVVCGYRRVGFAGRATPRASLQRVGSAGSILRTARPLDPPIVRTRKPDATKRRDKCQKCACMVLSLRSEQGAKPNSDRGGTLGRLAIIYIL